MRVFRQNFGCKVNCFVLRHACLVSVLDVTELNRSTHRRNRSGHCDMQCSRDRAVIVVLNSKRHGCSAHALGGDFAGLGVHLKNILVVYVVYAPSAAFVFCISRGKHSFQLALLILGKRERGCCRLLTFDSDCSRVGVYTCLNRDLDGFGLLGEVFVVGMRDRHRTSFLAGNCCGFTVAHNSCNILMIGFPFMIIVFSVTRQRNRFANLDRVFLGGDLGRLRVVQVRGVHGIVPFHRFSFLTCGFHRFSCLTFGFHRFSFLTCRFHRLGFLTCGFHRLGFLTCGFHRFGFLTCGFRRLGFLTCRFHRCRFLTFGFRRRGFLVHNARGFAFALVVVALVLCADRDAFGVLYEIIGQNAGGEHGKHHGNGKDHCNDSFFHRFFLLFFQIFSTLAGG